MNDLRSRIKKYKTTSIFFLVLFLSSCGFHLRGTIDVPKWLNNVAVISKNGDQQLTMLLHSLLEGYKIQVNQDPAQASYWLIVNNSQIKEQIISIGASTNPRQYQLTLTIEFLLQARTGKIIKPTQIVVVQRPLIMNNDRILGSNDEKSVLINEMRQEAAIQIINRLNYK